MQITRIQVEEGFLNGFDLSLGSGLNVLIGARGTGKTSVIELLRYALNAPNHTTDSQIRSLDHARAVLAGGQVTVMLSDLLDEVTVTRGSNDDHPQASGEYTAPIVLSQTEIETLGLSESGRLTLLDGFIPERATLRSDEAVVVSAIRTLYKEIKSLEAEIGSLGDDPAKLEAITQQIAALEVQQVKFQEGSSVVAERQASLQQLSTHTSELSVKEETLTRFERNVGGWEKALRELVTDDFGPDRWEGAEAEDPLSDLRRQYQENVMGVSKLQEVFSQLKTTAGSRRQSISNQRIEIDKQARSIRTELEKAAEGAGAVARQLTALRTQLAQLKSRNSVLSERQARLSALRKRRDESYSELEQIRSQRYKLRVDTAAWITKNLSPHIKVEVEHSAQYGEYTKAVSNALRGSGMKYGELAVTLSQRVSPKELLELTEKGDFTTLGELVEIPKDRAARLIGHLQDYGLVDILTCDVDDSVRMTLLDGVEYKDVASLSAGQRCTVVLSIVLQHKERTLVIDQPEDHLDNAFIASTVIKALRERRGAGQVILSTHNANIPVLGEADLVVELTSDGRNGFIQMRQPLGHHLAVSAITNVMEGGRDAFLHRAQFYDKHKQ